MASETVAMFWIQKSQNKCMEDERGMQDRKPHKSKAKRRWCHLLCCYSDKNRGEFVDATEIVEGHWEIPFTGQQIHIPADGQVLQQIRAESDLWESVSTDIPFRCFDVEAEVHCRPEEHHSVKSHNFNEEITSRDRTSPLALHSFNGKIIASNNCSRDNYRTSHMPKIISENCLRASKVDRGPECDSTRNCYSRQVMINYPAVTPIPKLSEINVISTIGDAALNCQFRDSTLDYATALSQRYHQFDCATESSKCGEINEISSFPMCSNRPSAIKRTDILQSVCENSQEVNTDSITTDVNEISCGENFDNITFTGRNSNSQTSRFMNSIERDRHALQSEYMTNPNSVSSHTKDIIGYFKKTHCF